MADGITPAIVLCPAAPRGFVCLTVGWAANPAVNPGWRNPDAWGLESKMLIEFSYLFQNEEGKNLLNNSKSQTRVHSVVSATFLFCRAAISV